MPFFGKKVLYLIIYSYLGPFNLFLNIKNYTY